MRFNGVLLTGVLALAVIAAAPTAEGQQAGKPPRIGFLSAESPGDPYTEAFRRGLQELGYIEGRTIAVEYRYASGDFDRVAALANELLALKPSAIVAAGTTPMLALRRASTTVPVVFFSVQDPLTLGVASSLARPGGNLTGLTCFAPELRGKRLELLKEAVPRLARVALLANPANPSTPLELPEAETAARSLGIRLAVVSARSPHDLEGAFASMARENLQALAVMPDPMLLAQRRRIAELAAKHRLPTIFDFREAVDAGGLLSYGPSIAGLHRRAAYFVDRILKGTAPSDLPIERPTRFELVINLKTAQALGLTLPPSIMVRADEVIQ